MWRQQNAGVSARAQKDVELTEEQENLSAARRVEKRIVRAYQQLLNAGRLFFLYFFSGQLCSLTVLKCF